jgi:hypothetical protein
MDIRGIQARPPRALAGYWGHQLSCLTHSRGGLFKIVFGGSFETCTDNLMTYCICTIYITLILKYGTIIGWLCPSSTFHNPLLDLHFIKFHLSKFQSHLNRSSCNLNFHKTGWRNINSNALTYIQSQIQVLLRNNLTRLERGRNAVGTRSRGNLETRSPLWLKTAFSHRKIPTPNATWATVSFDSWQLWTINIKLHPGLKYQPGLTQTETRHSPGSM